MTCQPTSLYTSLLHYNPLLFLSPSLSHYSKTLNLDSHFSPPRCSPLRHETGTTMEVDDNQCNFTALDSTSGQKRKLDETSGGGPVDLTGGGRFYGWPSSRIVRVSRASGGKDRHSKVLTSKGLRDRRVRLSVNTAIQFYDLQDRLGYDQPSKAVEWLLKAAASSITELPPMTMPFPETPKENNSNYSSHCQQMTKSNACSSNSETSKGSAVLSLSRSDSLVAASEKVKSENPISQTFTELLNGMGGSSNVDNSNTASPNGAAAGNGRVNETNYLEKSSPRNWSSSAPMDYFSGLFGAVNPVVRPPVFTLEQQQQHHHHPELQQFSIVPEQLIIPVAARGNHNEYNLNFKISSGSSSGLSSFPRGTLQSNSTSSSTPSPLFQRFPPVDSSSVPSYYIGTVENHNQFLSQLCFDPQADNNGRQSNQKGKGKN